MIKTSPNGPLKNFPVEITSDIKYKNGTGLKSWNGSMFI